MRHSVWVPPAAVLGEEVVAQLRTIPDDLAAAKLDAQWEAVADAETGAVTIRWR